MPEIGIEVLVPKIETEHFEAVLVVFCITGGEDSLAYIESALGRVRAQKATRGRLGTLLEENRPPVFCQPPPILVRELRCVGSGRCFGDTGDRHLLLERRPGGRNNEASMELVAIGANGRHHRWAVFANRLFKCFREIRCCDVPRSTPTCQPIGLS